MFSDIYNAVHDSIFNSKAKKQARINLQQIRDEHTDELHTAVSYKRNLNKLRETITKETFPQITSYINSLTNSPKDFDNSFTKLDHAIEVYNNKQSKQQADETENSNYSNEAAIIATSAVLGLVTDSLAFGLISAGTVLYTYCKKNDNDKSINKIQQKIQQIMQGISLLKIKQQQLFKINDATRQHSQNCIHLLNNLKNNTPSNYNYFNSQQKNELIALINNINSLSELLNQEIEN